MPTVAGVLQYAHDLEELSPGFLSLLIYLQTREDYTERDLLDKVARLIEIFGLETVGEIVGCPGN